MSNFLNAVEIGARGQRTLASAYYLSTDVFSAEQSRIWENQWLCVGRIADWSKPGDFQVLTVGRESVIVLRDQQGNFQSYFNLCRHRGTRLCETDSGSLRKTIQCPYHAWTYGLDGKLVGVPDEETFTDFRREEHSLHRVACRTWEGFVWLNLSSEPKPFETVFQELLEKFTAWNLPQLISLGRCEYDVLANWKLIVQNYSECYHCSPVHPALVKLTPSTSGGNDLVEGPFLGGYMNVSCKGGSLTLSGQACGASVGPLSPDDRQRVYYYVLFPNVLLSLHHDYVMFHTLWPQAPGRTRVVCEWLFHPDTATDPHWNPQDGIKFWDQTNREDWRVSELTQLGVSSSRYQPGPYSGRESMSAAFDRHYLSVMSAP